MHKLHAFIGEPQAVFPNVLFKRMLIWAVDVIVWFTDLYEYTFLNYKKSNHEVAG